MHRRSFLRNSSFAAAGLGAMSLFGSRGSLGQFSGSTLDPYSNAAQAFTVAISNTLRGRLAIHGSEDWSICSDLVYDVGSDVRANGVDAMVMAAAQQVDISWIRENQPSAQALLSLSQEAFPATALTLKDIDTALSLVSQVSDADLQNALTLLQQKGISDLLAQLHYNAALISYWFGYYYGDSNGYKHHDATNDPNSMNGLAPMDSEGGGGGSQWCDPNCGASGIGGPSGGNQNGNAYKTPPKWLWNCQPSTPNEKMGQDAWKVGLWVVTTFVIPELGILGPFAKLLSKVSGNGFLAFTILNDIFCGFH